MRVVMLYRQQEEYTSEIEGWMRDFTKETGIEVESLDPDSIEGEHYARAHDFVQYPTLAVLGPSNVVLQHWSGKMPMFDQVAYVMRSI